MAVSTLGANFDLPIFRALASPLAADDDCAALCASRLGRGGSVWLHGGLQVRAKIDDEQTVAEVWRPRLCSGDSCACARETAIEPLLACTRTRSRTQLRAPRVHYRERNFARLSRKCHARTCFCLPRLRLTSMILFKGAAAKEKCASGAGAQS
eukprot:6206918-Pleurochrysis_carterae.AAC.1